MSSTLIGRSIFKLYHRRHMADAWVSAIEAAKLLRVSRATLYAYVSRGFLRSEAGGGATRERRYSREDIERLTRKNEERRDPERAAQHALQWGLPILESSITLIAGGRLYYRGWDVAELARTRSVEEVASLIWTGDFATPIAFSAPPRFHLPRGVEGLSFIARSQMTLPRLSAGDRQAFDTRAAGVVRSGARIVTALSQVAALSASGPADGIAARVAQAWAPGKKGAVPLISAALILCADHELNVSSFTARCVASAGSNPYDVVIAGLSAIEGVKHGGESLRVAAFLDELAASRDLGEALAARLRRGERLPGFGHRLYPDGDPRATVLLELLAVAAPRSKELASSNAIAAHVHRILGDRPTVDFALVALERVLKLPAAASLTLFALGRSIGWIGHAIEQYQLDALIRPRAKYVGRMP
jgi:citrate synthase